MNAEVAGIVLLLAVAAILGVTAVLRLRAQTKPSARMLHARERSAGTIRKREPELEARIESVLRGPRQKYGAIFTEYSVWRAGRSRFHDQGLDWRTFGDGPQFVEEP